ncbi:hypothetical protein [Streptomyces sp. NK08204]|nr:hypothetical protein [Streptomyces sp. NK08204]
MSDSSPGSAHGAGWGAAEPGAYERLTPDRVETPARLRHRQ